MEKIGKKCIIRTEKAGVFFGTLSEFDAATCVAAIKDCRKLWYWDGACAVEQLALDGTTEPDNCKFTVQVDEIEVMGVIQILPCTAKSIQSIEKVKAWKR